MAKKDDQLSKQGLGWTIFSAGVALLSAVIFLSLELISFPTLKFVMTIISILVFLYLGIDLIKIGLKIIRK